MEKTIPGMFEQSVRKYSKNILMKEKIDSAWDNLTYAEMRGMVLNFAAGLLKLGIKKGDRVALISEGRNAWVMSELGILYAGAVNVPISVKIDELSDLKFRLSHSGCRAVIVSGSQTEKIRSIKKDLADLEKVILLDTLERIEEDEVLSADLLISGEKFLAENASICEAAWKDLKENDYANICYTSGTTADPKGIILTHRNYTANVEQAAAMFDIPQYYTSLLILPWDHAFAHTAGIYTLIYSGASMASVQNGKSALETLKNIPVNMKEIRPSFLLSVPALAKNFRKNIESGIRLKGGKIEKLFQSALNEAINYNAEGFNRGRGLKLIKKPLLMVYDKLLFSKIRESFGGKLEFFVGGGALLDIELQRFFYAIGIPMYQGYGLTEAAPIISSNTPRKHKLGTSGKIVPNLKVKICNEKGETLPKGIPGEIVIQGENVMAGYWKNEKATQETIRDGWLFTGDLGYMDKDDYLMVLGRNKSLLIASDGEKYSPEGIEEGLVENSDFIDQVMLYNNQNTYTAALIVPNREAMKRLLNAQNISWHTEEGQNTVLKLIEAEIDAFRDGGKYSGQFPSRWLPSAIAVLGEGFTEQNKFLNSTLKMVRGKITEFYKNRIDFLYTPEGKNICNHQNRTIISRL